MATIALLPEEYWELRARAGDERRAHEAAQQISAKQGELVKALAEKYHFDPKTANAAMNDEALTLTIADIPQVEP